MKTNEKQFTPQWFLKSLGNGGLTVSFFVYLMFMIKHQTPIPTFVDITRELKLMNFTSLLVGLDLLAIIYFAFNHYKQLIIQLVRYKEYKKTEAYRALKGTNEEIGLMTIPLTLAMSMNVLLIVAALFVPGLWDVIEYLFPVALVAFLAIGVYGMKLLYDYATDTLLVGNFDFITNNTLGQMIAPFAFVMVAVGIAAPAAMSHNIAINVIGLVTSIFFLVLTLVLTNIKLFLGLKSIFKHGIDEKAAPTLWIIIPIMTLTGITFVRLMSAIYHHMIHAPLNPIVFMVVITIFVSIQLLFGLLGYKILKQNNYFKNYLNGDKFSPGSFALVCPGVAVHVLGMFFLYYGFVKTKFISEFGIVYFIILAPIIYTQIKTVSTLNKLNKKSA